MRRGSRALLPPATPPSLISGERKYSLIKLFISGFRSPDQPPATPRSHVDPPLMRRPAARPATTIPTATCARRRGVALPLHRAVTTGADWKRTALVRINSSGADLRSRRPARRRRRRFRASSRLPGPAAVRSSRLVPGTVVSDACITLILKMIQWRWSSPAFVRRRRGEQPGDGALDYLYAPATTPTTGAETAGGVLIAGFGALYPARTCTGFALQLRSAQVPSRDRGGRGRRGLRRRSPDLLEAR